MLSKTTVCAFLGSALLVTQMAAAAQVEAGNEAAGSEGTEVSGYVEASYRRLAGTPQDARADLDRVVLEVERALDARTHVEVELEIEHAVSSRTDKGEVAIEEAYAGRAFGAALRLRAGLFVVPVGWLNTHHRPGQHLGVVRNEVETAIIPAVWREGGVLLDGDVGETLRWSAGLVTGFDLSRWDPNSAEGRDSPLGSVHQELSLARAARPAWVVTLEHRAAEDWLAGASYYTGDGAQGQPGYGAMRVQLAEVHLRYQRGPFSASALHAAGAIGGTNTYNATLAPGSTLIPARFGGSQIEASWQFAGAWAATPFLRWQRYNTGERFDVVGSHVAALAMRTQWVVGIQAQWARGLVVKADYLDEVGSSSANRLAAGVGFTF
jgi:hypothetical protein